MAAHSPSIDTPNTPLFILTVDTEEEWDWAGEFPRKPFSTQNIEQIPAFQTFCGEFGLKPTYFIDYAVSDNPTHASILKDCFLSGKCDFGAHLHPWANPPIEEEICDFNSHALNLPISLFERKVQALTSKLESVFGAHPYSYRAGRWGINGQHLKVLAANGYRVDSSVRPFYKDPNFSYKSASTKPYWPSYSDVLANDEQQTEILELPTSSGFNWSNFELLDRVHGTLSTPPLNCLRGIGILWQLGLLRKITVTPEGQEPEDICRCIDAAIARGDRIINMFFHSSDLMPGCTPYVQTEADKTRFLQCLSHCFEHVKNQHSAEFTTMRKIRKQLTGLQ